MNFRTEYKAKKSKTELWPGLPVVLIGSCFSQNIAQKMRAHLWDGVNATGTLFNPLSVARVVRLMCLDHKPEKMMEDSLFTSDGSWRSWLFDSKFMADTPEECIRLLEAKRKEFNDSLEKGKTLIVTFGTSICYSLEATGEVVGNCHKQSASLFRRSRRSLKEIEEVWDILLTELKEKIPGLRVIFTVSPVRHVKEGFEDNARSKATLILAVDALCNRHENCIYFPAYEILNDDLRDYRFYAGDLVHPSEEAIDYVWEKFKETFLSPEGCALLEKGLKIWKALSHRPLEDALGKVSTLRREKDRERLEKVYAEYEELLREFPGMLRSDKKFH